MRVSSSPKSDCTLVVCCVSCGPVSSRWGGVHVSSWLIPAELHSFDWFDVEFGSHVEVTTVAYERDLVTTDMFDPSGRVSV